MISTRAFSGWLRSALLGLMLMTAGICSAAVITNASPARRIFPPSLESYGDAHLSSVWAVLVHRARQQPFNVVATLLFLCAIIHTGMTQRFRHLAHKLAERHEEKLRGAGANAGAMRSISGSSRFFHFLGEVEAVFGIWVVPLIIAMSMSVGASATAGYFHDKLSFTEPVFVVVVMAVASTRPILSLAERLLQKLARLGGETPAAWWLSILLAGPLLGSLITEPAAMTICAVLLSRKFYGLRPSPRFAYATLGLLFVSISTGGTLTHFAAPPVLMVANAWGWDTPFMLTQFGWKAVLGIAISACAYFLLFRKELQKLSVNCPRLEEERESPIPLWVTAAHLLFLGLSVVCAHYTIYLVLTLLFFIAFVEVTEDFQRNFALRTPMLVGFFLAGLVIHGGLQQWWIAPLLGSLKETPLFLGALGLTAFNDNAAITYLCTLVPSLTDGMKYAAVAGAVAGGGLTVIANAPNPAGQSILQKHFPDGIGMLGLLAGAILPTVVQGLIFLLFR